MNTSVARGNYIVIQDFMVNELQLKGNDLLVYAIIYGFSQSEGQKYTGSLQYLADWTNSTKRGIQKNLQFLLEKRYIEKEEKYINGIKFISYFVSNLYIEQSSMVWNKVRGGIEQSSTNNIEYNKESINNNKLLFIPKKETKKFVKPTLEEVKEYCLERKNNIDAETFIDFYESKGWYVGKNKMKDWKATIRTWERNRKQNQQENQPSEITWLSKGSFKL